MKHCAVLIVNGETSVYGAFLRDAGFRVTETREWPDEGDDIRNYHAVILRLPKIQHAAMIAARLRAKPHFGRRVLLALVDPRTASHDRRSSLEAGFDAVIDDDGNCRVLAARLLRCLRSKPELRCMLPPPDKRRSAA